MTELEPMRDASYQMQSRATITAVFEHFQKQPELPYVLFQKPAARPVLKAFKATQVEASIMQTQRLGLQQADAGLPVAMVIDNVVVQLFGMVEWWLDQDPPPTPELMALYYEQMVLRPMWTLLLGTDGMQKLLPQ